VSTIETTVAGKGWHTNAHTSAGKWVVVEEVVREGKKEAGGGNEGFDGEQD
jgi:hypothetical protein